MNEISHFSGFLFFIIRSLFTKALYRGSVNDRAPVTLFLCIRAMVLITFAKSLTRSSFGNFIAIVLVLKSKIRFK